MVKDVFGKIEKSGKQKIKLITKHSNVTKNDVFKNFYDENCLKF